MTGKLKPSLSKLCALSTQHIALDYLNLKPICLKSFHFFPYKRIITQNLLIKVNFQRVLDDQRSNKFIYFLLSVSSTINEKIIKWHGTK